MHREKYVREKDLRTDANASQLNNEETSNMFAMFEQWDVHWLLGLVV